MADKHHLVIEHLENIGAEVFERFAPVITRFVDRRNGIYALYKGEALYYVGLASNLKGRVKQHLSDRHAHKWDRFSVYLTQGDRYMRELESLLLRITPTKGNRVKGKLAGSRDLKRELQQNIKELQRMELSGLLGNKHAAAKPKQKAPKKDTALPMAERLVFLKREYKGKLYRATWRRDGTVKLNGALYDSLSAAGRAVTKRGTNGWSFWMARNEEGEWVKLNAL
jgi:hypothetical protein